MLSQKKLIFFTILKEEAATTIIVDHRSHVWGECDPCGGRGRTSGVEIIARLPINQLDPGPAPAPASPHREGYIDREQILLCNDDQNPGLMKHTFDIF